MYMYGGHLENIQHLHCILGCECGVHFLNTLEGKKNEVTQKNCLQLGLICWKGLEDV